MIEELAATRHGQEASAVLGLTLLSVIIMLAIHAVANEEANTETLIWIAILTAALLVTIWIFLVRPIRVFA